MAAKKENPWEVEQDGPTKTIWMRHRKRRADPLVCAVCQDDRVVATGSNEFHALYPKWADGSSSRAMICPNCVLLQGPEQVPRERWNKVSYMDMDFTEPRLVAVPGWKLNTPPTHAQGNDWRAPRSRKGNAVHESVYGFNELMIWVRTPE